MEGDRALNPGMLVRIQPEERTTARQRRPGDKEIIMLHPTAEAYRQAMARGDTMSAAAIMVDAHTGDYNQELVDQLHRVGRMTRAELLAPAQSTSSDVPVDKNETGRVTVTARIFGRR
jgi:NAD(P)H-nitrite reductase large subunit